MTRNIYHGTHRVGRTTDIIVDSLRVRALADLASEHDSQIPPESVHFPIFRGNRELVFSFRRIRVPAVDFPQIRVLAADFRQIRVLAADFRPIRHLSDFHLVGADDLYAGR